MATQSSPRPEACFRPWQHFVVWTAVGHPKGRSEAEERHSRSTRRRLRDTSSALLKHQAKPQSDGEPEPPAETMSIYASIRKRPNNPGSPRSDHGKQRAKHQRVTVAAEPLQHFRASLHPEQCLILAKALSIGLMPSADRHRTRAPIDTSRMSRHSYRRGKSFAAKEQEVNAGPRANVAIGGDCIRSIPSSRSRHLSIGPVPTAPPASRTRHARRL